MKKIFLILTICLLSFYAKTQVVFNRIIEDTLTHITNSIIVLDSGYVLSTGSRDNAMIRCFALTYVNSDGEKQWKRTYTDLMNEYWEGFANNLKIYGNITSLMGSYYNILEEKRGVHFTVLDSSFDLKTQIVINYDSVWKKCYNHIMFDGNTYFLTGQVHDDLNDITKAMLIRVDSVGSMIWMKTYGQKYELGAQILKTSDKNILIGGLTFSFPTTVTDEDWYLIKLDTAGNLIWQNGFGRPGFLNYDGAVAGLIETQDSNYVACGGYPALRSDTDTYWDGCLRKVSKDGDLMWERFYRSYSSISNPVTDWFENSISSVLYKNDDLFVIGNWRSRIGRSRGYLQKITENGDICWNREYYAIDYTTNDQYFVSFQPTADNGFILAGYGNNYNSYGYNPAQQAWLVKTDSLGIDGLCYTAPPELNIDIVLPETVNCSDTITVYTYIAGKSAPYTIETSIGQVIDSIYYPPLFVPVEIGLSQAEIEYGGNIIYTQQITEATLSNHEWGQCIAKPVQFYTPHTSGSQQITIMVTDAYGESKMILKDVFVNDCGSGIAEEDINSVNLYPNPAVDNLYLDISGMVVSSASWRINHLAVNCDIYNSMGQLVKTLQLSNDLTVINIKDFASGVYQIKIIDGDGNVVVRSFEKQ
jgi:hypothetical protein